MSEKATDKAQVQGGRNVPAARIQREKQTIEAMLRLFCRDHHGGNGQICGDCEALLSYAWQRLDNCPFEASKPACNRCEVHCYSAAMREQVRAVMRYSGPRMLLRHPVLSVRHLIDERRPVPSLKSAKSKRNL